jgi:Uma2 family endonuclease
MISLDLSPIATLTREDFHKLCAANPEMKLELTATGELIVMSPTGGDTGNLNSSINGELYLWNRENQAGKVFDSSTGFGLPNGADRSPDLSWIPAQKWMQLTPEERKGFLPLCPDFVVELLSPSDSWKKTQEKMDEYMANGCRLGWLIDPKRQRVAIYRQGKAVEVLDSPISLSGEDILPGFLLNSSLLWSCERP